MTLLFSFLFYNGLYCLFGFIAILHIGSFYSVSYDCLDCPCWEGDVEIGPLGTLIKYLCFILSANVTRLKSYVHSKQLCVKIIVFFFPVEWIEWHFCPACIYQRYLDLDSRLRLGNTGGVVHSRPLLHSQVFEGHRPCGRETGASNRGRDMATQWAW